MKEDIKYFPRPSKSEPFMLDMTGISYCDGTYKIERKNSHIYVFEYIIDGTGTVISDGKEYTASKGDVYVLHKGCSHKYFSDASNPWTKIFFNISGELVDSLILTYGLEQMILVKQCEIYQLFLDFYEIASSQELFTKMNDLCTLKLHEIIIALSKSNKGQSEHSEEALKLKEVLDGSINHNITIGELSASIFRSPDYTIKLFKREFGQTPYLYLINKKIEISKSLLKGTNLSVKAIASELSFCDQHYFSNLFKKMTGLSPKAYRNN